jgi:hypothetical protein
MTRASLWAAGGIVVAANLLALAHVARNRAGMDAEITLTERETGYFSRSYDDDSGVALTMISMQPPGWLAHARLAELGFDCSLDIDRPEADRFYYRQRPRQAYVALEYAPAAEGSQLAAVDADLDAGRLRSRHPDRSRAVVVPAVLGIGVNYLPVTPQEPKPRRVLQGYVREMPSQLHVPRPYSDAFRSGLSAYRIQVRYGALLEPWVTGLTPGR